jgi:hypothetical protein
MTSWTSEMNRSQWKRGVVVLGVVVLAERDHGAAGAVVEHRVEVELVDELAVTRTQLVSGQTRGRAGSEEAVEGMDQDRTAAVSGGPFGGLAR